MHQWMCFYPHQSFMCVDVCVFVCVYMCVYATLSLYNYPSAPFIPPPDLYHYPDFIWQSRLIRVQHLGSYHGYRTAGVCKRMGGDRQPYPQRESNGEGKCNWEVKNTCTHINMRLPALHRIIMLLFPANKLKRKLFAFLELKHNIIFNSSSLGEKHGHVATFL